MPYRITVNGESHRVDAAPDTPLLYVLRNDLGLNGPKFGCGLGQCGACAAMVGGKLARTCSITLRDVGAGEVTTLEGLGSAERPHPLQRAFIAEQALQCGYCVSGILMSAAALLKQNPRPTEAQVRLALDRNLCRCGAHNRMVRAVLRAAEEVATR